MPHRRLSRTLLAVIALAGVLTVALPGFFLLNGHGSSLLTDRHGLPSSVPLPDGATFKLTQNAGNMAEEWFWTAESPNDPATLKTFYQSHLASGGWSHIQVVGSNGDYNVTGCQSNLFLFVDINTSVQVTDSQGKTTSTINAPAGGSVLDMVTNSDPSVVPGHCS